MEVSNKMEGVALLFPGQGSQQAGMGSGPFFRSKQARSLMNRANSLLGFDLSSFMFGDSNEALRPTEIA